METINISAAPVRISIANFLPRKNLLRKHSRFHIISVSKQLNESINVSKRKDGPMLNSNGITTTRTVYKDNWFDRIAINYLSEVLQDTSDHRYEKLKERVLMAASRAIFLSFDPIEQRLLIGKVLLNAIPPSYIPMFRKLFPPRKFSREFCAAFTTIFFTWLVGPCKVKESEFEGAKEKNVVCIKKCRFLEMSNCAGMCMNLCKAPTQEFMKNTFGMPMNMVPNFEDMSCEYIFGKDPPPLRDYPAFKQPCYKLCNVKRKHDTRCISEGVI
ncbi:beta-carotene isomerase D27, chloroplastic-like [Bidens hawaiensis]|uniref:beta-carotene isomerase D27, chloroplastic-like n=1 Tax=Bidens hawaiensis TaxID=980011 RepID=UPI004049801F